MWEEGVHKNDLPTDLLQSLVRIHLEVTLVPISICHQGLAQTLCLYFIVQKMSCEAPGGVGRLCSCLAYAAGLGGPVLSVTQ